MASRMRLFACSSHNTNTAARAISAHARGGARLATRWRK